jgi:hypothetical protein
MMAVAGLGIGAGMDCEPTLLRGLSLSQLLLRCGNAQSS